MQAIYTLTTTFEQNELKRNEKKEKKNEHLYIVKLSQRVKRDEECLRLGFSRNDVLALSHTEDVL